MSDGEPPNCRLSVRRPGACSPEEVAEQHAADALAEEDDESAEKDDESASEFRGKRAVLQASGLWPLAASQAKKPSPS